MTTIRACLEAGGRSLECSGILGGRLDAQVLLAHVLGMSREMLLAHGRREVDEARLRTFEALVQRRALHEPVAYLLGRREFWSIELEVTPAVLIPRPETEVLIEVCLELLSSKGTTERLRALEIGVGSGAIAIALATERENLSLLATDVSTDALPVAEHNIARHRLTHRVELRQGDLYDCLHGDEHFDLVVSNPPYVAERERDQVMEDVLRYEPHLALFAGEDGLDVIRRLVAGAPDHLDPEGFLAFEIGASQGDLAARVLSDRGFRDIKIRNDYAGLSRVASGRWSPLYIAP